MLMTGAKELLNPGYIVKEEQCFLFSMCFIQKESNYIGNRMCSKNVVKVQTVNIYCSIYTTTNLEHLLVHAIGDT